MKNLLIVFLSLMSITAMAQKGTIKGLVKDKQTGEEIIGANVFVEGTSTGAATDIMGNFQFQVEPGTYNLIATFIGYANFKIQDLTVGAGEVVELTVLLQTDDVQLEEVVVTAKADQTSENLLLLERKNAVEIKQSIGAQELSRKGVGDAQAAVTKVTGVSKQEGVKNVFVRGLGDRYNSTSLNGLPLPSEDPEYKNISLDFFSTSIINSVDINKTFNPSIFGDVDGANINIVSKELFEDQELRVSLSAGLNTGSVGQDFLRPDGSNMLGTGLSEESPITDLTQYDFNNSFKPSTVSMPLNSSFSVSGGKRLDIGSHKLDAFLVASVQNEYVYKEGITRSAVSSDGGAGRDYTYKAFDYNVAQIFMGNFNYDLTSNIDLSYNTMYIHNNSQMVGEYAGQAQNLTEVDGRSAFIRRQQVNDNDLFVNQLLADVSLSDKINLNLAGSFNSIRGSEPDRRTNTFLLDENTGEYSVAAGSAGLNHRFFSTLEEDDVNAEAVFSYALKGDKDGASKFELGYSYRNTQRNFGYRQFSFDFANQAPVDINNPDATLFNQQSINDDIFRLITTRGFNQEQIDVFAPDTYDGSKIIHSAIANFNYELSDRFVLGAGVRYETVRQEVIWDFNQDRNEYGENLSERNPNYILPSFNLKYSISENDIIRLAASKSYTFPQFKEVAPFLYEDVNFSSFGNPDLKPADNYNVDLKFEKYFGKGNLFAVTGFYKHIENAINRVLVTSAATELSYVNTGNADVSGIELEFQKKIWEKQTGDKFSSFSVGANASYLYSKQKLEDDPDDKLTVLFTHDEAELEGASPLLLNADISYKSETENKGITAALVFNYFSDRIYTIGTADRDNIMEKGIPTLDIISSYRFNKNFQVDFKAQNILDPEYKLSQDIGSGESFVIQNFQRGAKISLGLTFKL
ncbi:TonB-dependent receptor [Fulvivirga ligni]|uniref:TonB-dependent receptor n=1 Tax=Fulvivirga ligni TaxID=2904246 RepID=UPI001F18BD40|nr:TonB-dependent receptor [Fulvivirga ligni]UII22066.1 TonB-dependent receptor [Fulvivirga ligni]